MLNLQEMSKDANRFNKKTMPLSSEIFDNLFCNALSDDYQAIESETDSDYKTFLGTLTEDQVRMFGHLEERRFVEEEACSQREGFNCGVYYGFHLAMELLKGGDLYGVVKRNRD